MVVLMAIMIKLNLHCVRDAIFHDRKKRPALAACSQFRIIGGEFQFTKHPGQQGVTLMLNHCLNCVLILMVVVLGLDGLVIVECWQFLL